MKKVLLLILTLQNIIKWIYTYGLSRRNLSNYQRSVLALQLEEVFSIKAKENLKVYSGNQYESGGLSISTKVQKIETLKENQNPLINALFYISMSVKVIM